jgi:hypothetical protein
VLRAVSEGSKTFDFGESNVTGSEFEDVESTADTLLVATGGSDNNRFRRVVHMPGRADLWTKVGAVAGVAGIGVAVVLYLLP